MFIERLNVLLSERGTTITPVLKEIGLSTSKGTAWNGGSIPNGAHLVLLADYFNVSIDWLMDRTDIRTVGKVELPQNENQLLQIFKQLDDEGKRLALGVTQTLLTEHAQKNSADNVNEVTA